MIGTDLHIYITKADILNGIDSFRVTPIPPSGFTCVGEGSSLSFRATISYPVSNVTFTINGIQTNPTYEHHNCYGISSTFIANYNGNAGSFE